MSKARIAGVLVAAAIAVATPFVAGWEGKENKPYLDAVNVVTVCYGHTKTAATGGARTDAQCQELLKQDLTESMKAVGRHVKVPLTEARLVALSSFVFNVGEGAFMRSTLLRKLNAGDTVGACNELMRWVNAGGRKLKGLERRRAAERELCLRGL